MHNEIFLDGQRQLLPFLKTFSDQFGLVGGTAIALHLGHRRSIDFDLFSNIAFDNSAVRQRIAPPYAINTVLRDSQGDYTVVINGVKCTFFHYPFHIDFSENLEDVIKMPDLITLAALKAYALGRRSTWKDYVDLYFILQEHSLKEIVQKARQLFDKEFNEKLFRSQLAYFDDLDTSETIAYLPGKEISKEKIKRSLTAIALE